MKVHKNIILTVVFTVLLGQAALASGLVEPEAVPGEYIVKLRPAKGPRIFSQSLGQQLGAYIKSTIPSAGLVVVKRAVMETQASAVASLQQNDLVEYAEPNYIYRINKTPNDPDFLKLWGLENIELTSTNKKIDIDAVRAWDIATGSAKMLVAVIDTGIDYNHPDLKDNVWTNEIEANGKPGVDDDNNGYIDDIHGYNFLEAENPTPDILDDHGHGSHCAGTIGARGNNGIGITGINWNVKIMSVKFMSADRGGTLEGAIRSVDYATKMGAKVFSNSWGGGSYAKSLEEAIQRSHDAGALFVAGAGNDGTNNDEAPFYPASYKNPNVISVAAVDSRGNFADFSNYGQNSVHLAAPGVNIISTYKDGGYARLSGTSMATPHVSGVAALVWSHEPKLTNLELKKRLLSTVQDVPRLRGKLINSGIVNAYQALINQTTVQDSNDPENWKSHDIAFSTDHPYASNTKISFEINIPGAKEISLYFDKFATEEDHDFLSVYDAKGNLLGRLSGVKPNGGMFSPPYPGNYLKLVFTSDNDMEQPGFDLTKVAYR